ncbi:MAG: serine hydrolase [Xanthomonadales bacterium]|nr:serine hydrolase [Xanthomonadales bacterium]
MTRPTLRSLALALGLGATANSMAATATTGDVDSWITGQQKTGQIAAASVSRVDGSSVESRGFGAIDGANGAKPDAETQFQIGSITKVFTDLLLAESVASGTVRYDTPIGALLPATLKPANPAVAAITLEALATHHSGLPRLPANLDLSNAADPYAGYDEAKLWIGVEQTRAAQRLGDFYAYSNFGVGLLGHLLGNKLETGYRQAVEQHVVRPLALSRTGFRTDTNAARAMSGGKAVQPWGFDDALAAAGALWGSTGDLAKLVQAYLGTHEHALRHTLEDDLRVVASADAFHITRVWHVAQADGKPVFWHNGGTAGFHSFVGFRPDNSKGIAILVSGDADPTNVGLASLGVAPVEPKPDAIDETVFGQYQLNEQFGIGVYAEHGLLVAQASGQPAFALSPVGDDWYAFGAIDASLRFVRKDGSITGLELAQNGHIQKAPRTAMVAASQAKEQVEVDRDALSAYVGTFDFAPGVTLSVKLGDETLMAQLSGQPAFPVFARGDDRFFYKVVDAELQFERDASGQVNAVVLHQGGIVQRAPKAK